jgi:hypothetical protein
MAVAKFQPAPPREQSFHEVDEQGKPTGKPAQPWYQWFQLLPARLTSPAVGATPVNSTDKGTPGQILFDGNFLYICIAANVWRRIPHTAF